MRVRELVSALLDMDQDMPVVLRVQVDPSHDSEDWDPEDVLGEDVPLADRRSVVEDLGRAVLVGDWSPS